MVQWLRICLARQRAQVRFLVWEDPPCGGATMPVCHSYWTHALEPERHKTEAHVPGAHALQQEKPPQGEARGLQLECGPRSPQPEKARVQQQRPTTARIRKELKKRIILNKSSCRRIHSGVATEKAMAPHSSTLAWKFPGTEEPGRLQSMGLLRVGQD